MRAIIYAAGRNTRLGAAYTRFPKLLLEFGGRSLLEWHVTRLLAVGVSDVMLVTGFERPQIQEAMQALQARHPVRLHDVENPRFAEGSVLSMERSLGALRGLSEPILLMDGDVLYAPTMLERLVKSPHPTALLIDRDFATDDDDPVLVPVRNGRPVEFKKQWQGDAEQVGESIGFFKLSPQDAPALVAITERLSGLDASGPVETPYEEVIREMVRADQFGHEDVTGLPWTEIDFPQDITRAERDVLPRILEAAAGAES